MDFRRLDRTWIAAEIGVNHEGDEAVAIDLINKAAHAGADAVKFQTFEIEHYISTEQPERYHRTKGFQLSRDAFRVLLYPEGNIRGLGGGRRYVAAWLEGTLVWRILEYNFSS